MISPENLQTFDTTPESMGPEPIIMEDLTSRAYAIAASGEEKMQTSEGIVLKNDKYRWASRWDQKDLPDNSQIIVSYYDPRKLLIVIHHRRIENSRRVELRFMWPSDIEEANDESKQLILKSVPGTNIEPEESPGFDDEHKRILSGIISEMEKPEAVDGKA